MMKTLPQPRTVDESVMTLSRPSPRGRCFSTVIHSNVTTFCLFYRQDAIILPILTKAKNRKNSTETRSIYGEKPMGAYRGVDFGRFSTARARKGLPYDR